MRFSIRLFIERLHTKGTYETNGKKIMEYFKKPFEEVTTDELRDYLLKYLKQERGLSERSVNYYNSIIRFMSEVTMDKLINKKQLPMIKKKKVIYKILTKEELESFFNCVDNYKFKTIFMLAYGTGLRIGEIANLRVEDVDSKKMRIFVREGKENKERYTILPKETLKMLRKYWLKYRQHKKGEKIFLKMQIVLSNI